MTASGWLNLHYRALALDYGGHFRLQVASRTLHYPMYTACKQLCSPPDNDLCFAAAGGGSWSIHWPSCRRSCTADCC